LGSVELDTAVVVELGGDAPARGDGLDHGQVTVGDAKGSIWRRELNPVADREVTRYLPVDVDAGQAAGIIGNDIPGSLFDGQQIHCRVCTHDRGICSTFDARLWLPRGLPPATPI